MCIIRSAKADIKPKKQVINTTRTKPSHEINNK